MKIRKCNCGCRNGIILDHNITTLGELEEALIEYKREAGISTAASYDISPGSLKEMLEAEYERGYLTGKEVEKNRIATLLGVKE